MADGGRADMRCGVVGRPMLLLLEWEIVMFLPFWVNEAQ